MSLSEAASATRCVLYPDTTACGLSSAPGSSRPASSCRLVVREPAPQVYLRTGEPISQSRQRVITVTYRLKGRVPPCSPDCLFVSSERLPLATTVSIPGRGILQGVAVETALGSDRTKVIQFLGVPYARPPVGSLRFEEAQPADWTGTWDATKPR